MPDAMAPASMGGATGGGVVDPAAAPEPAGAIAVLARASVPGRALLSPDGDRHEAAATATARPMPPMVRRRCASRKATRRSSLPVDGSPERELQRRARKHAEGQHQEGARQERERDVPRAH